MKNLFEAERIAEVRERIARLGPESRRKWGKMDLAQALAHCSGSLEMALGEIVSPRMLIGRIIGRVIKRLALGNDEPMRRNSPTIPDLTIQDQRILEKEKERLDKLIIRFAGAGPDGCSKHPHGFFGRMTPEEWATLMYKHLDHHLRQFGA